MTQLFLGHLSKMSTEYHPSAPTSVRYFLNVDSQQISTNEWLGKALKFEYLSEIKCCGCGSITKKSFNQGYCYRCFQKLPQCDRCIMSPELCHFSQGTCRDEAWGQRNCMTEHVVYLANSTGLKVGITRASQVPTRWIDQGAIQAIPLMNVSTRQASGLVEDLMREWLPDRTNWRKLLKNEVSEHDMLAERDRIQELAVPALELLEEQYEDLSFEWDGTDSVYQFSYPHLEWPEKAKTYNLDKTAEIEDRLIAIKGQYLIFENGALNVRKFGSYLVRISEL